MDLQALYVKYAADVRRFVYLWGDPALADDLTSETFCTFAPCSHAEFDMLFKGADWY
jgi:hypothetical protein